MGDKHEAKPHPEPEPEPGPERDSHMDDRNPLFRPTRNHSKMLKIDHDTDKNLAIAEPFPDISNAGRAWAIAWPTYTYLTGCLFAILCFYCFSSIVTVMFSKRQPARRKNIRSFIIAINSQMMLLAFCRSVDLLIDPYNIQDIFPPVMYAILSNIPLPCLSSAFGLVNWVIIQVSKLRLNSASRVRSFTFLITVIFAHYIVVTCVTIFTHFVMRIDVLLIVCQGFFVLWGILLCVGFFVGAFKIIKLEKASKASLYKSTESAVITPTTKRKTWITSSPMATPPGSPLIIPRSRHGKTSPHSGSPLWTRPGLPKGANKRRKSATAEAASTNPVYSITAEMLTPLSVLVTPVAMDIKEVPSTKSGEFQFQTPGSDNAEDIPDVAPTRMTLTKLILEATQHAQETIPHSSLTDTRYNDTPHKELAVAAQQRRRPRSKIVKVLRISGAAAVLGLIASGLNLFGILVVFADGVRLGMDDARPGLWEWFSYQVLSR